MKILPACVVVFLSLHLTACNPNENPIDTWDVEVRLLETTPFPEIEEIQPYDDALIAHNYELVSAVPVDRESPALISRELIIYHWAIRDKKAIESVKDLKRGDVKRYTIQRRTDRPDLNGRYIKNGLDDFDLFLFVEAETEPQL